MRTDQSNDLKGRAYATVADLKEGDTVEVDGDFTCLKNGARRRVLKHDGQGALYIGCIHGIHFLDGQLSDDGLYYVGIYKVPLA